MALAADAADVADLLGVVFTTDQEVRAERLLTLAEAAITNEVPGICFVATTGSITLKGTTGDTLYVPKRPLATITSLTVDGAAIASDAYTFNRRGEVVDLAWSLLSSLWGDETSTIVVGYTAGPTDDDVRLIAAELVRNLWVNPAGLKAETIGQRSATFDEGGAGLELTDAHRSTLKRYKSARRSVRLGAG